MNKLLACLMALLLLCGAAMAEVKVESTATVNSYISLADGTNCYIDGGYRTGYYVVDANGNVLSGTYNNLYDRQGGLYYEYQGSDVRPCSGRHPKKPVLYPHFFTAHMRHLRPFTVYPSPPHLRKEQKLAEN